LKYAIDRDDIVRRVFVGHATPGNDNPIPPPPSIKYAVNPEPRFSYNPEKAKYHLKKAGLTSLKVDLSAADAAFQGAVDVAVLCKEYAAKCGIEINVVREADDAYWDNVWQKKGWCASYWSGRSTCDWMFTQAYLSSSTQNETHWKNAHFDELLLSARSQTDEAKRAAMYAEMQQLIHDDGGAIVLVFRNYVDAHSKKIAHGTIGNNWECDGMRIAERWWFV
jgi:peptide/nickel transport system substrate-binding protein